MKNETHYFQSVEPFLTIKQAAKKIGINYRTLLRAVKEGTVPHHKIINSPRLIRLSELYAAMEHYNAEGDCDD